MRTENAEFISLWEASGWTKAETARRLDLSRSAIGKFVEGTTMPSVQTLRLFKFVLASERPGALTGTLKGAGMELADWERKLFDELRGLAAEDRERVLNAVKAFAAGLPRNPAAAPAERSKVDAGAARLLKQAAKGVSSGPAPEGKSGTAEEAAGAELMKVAERFQHPK